MYIPLQGVILQLLSFPSLSSPSSHTRRPRPMENAFLVLLQHFIIFYKNPTSQDRKKTMGKFPDRIFLLSVTCKVTLSEKNSKKSPLSSHQSPIFNTLMPAPPEKNFFANYVICTCFPNQDVFLQLHIKCCTRKCIYDFLNSCTHIKIQRYSNIIYKFSHLF